MNAGRELDAIVHEKVMGKPKSESEKADFFITESGGIGFDIPSYSTDISAAWEVVEKLNCPYTISKNFMGYKVDLLPSPGIRIETAAESAPHAICLAALKACGVEL